jgi:hypothetical protein
MVGMENPSNDFMIDIGSGSKVTLASAFIE